MDSVLTNLNRLNRAMEPILVIGNEFGSVEALWSTFEGVMGDGGNTSKEEERGATNAKTRDPCLKTDPEMRREYRLGCTELLGGSSPRLRPCKR